MSIGFEKLLNGRDEGGISAGDGRRVKSGLLLRTAELARATDADIEILRTKYAVKHIIDFRDKSECARTPDRDIPGADYHNFPALPALPVSDPDAASGFPVDIPAMFKRIYRELAESDTAKAAYEGFFEILLRGDGAVLWHCTQGKDRTGVAAILLLTALGVSEADIMRDYFLSNGGLGAELEKVKAGASDSDKRRLDAIYTVSQECIDVYFASVGARFGGVHGVLTQCLDLSQQDIERLRELYTE